MNNKLSGTIFLIFGLGLVIDNTSVLLGDTTESIIKPILYLFIGISSCIYGYKQIKDGYPDQSEDKS